MYGQQALMAEYTQMNRDMLRMGKLILEIVKAIDLLQENVERLDISWSGEANTQFMLAFYEDFNKMRNITEDMLKQKKLLRSVISEYQKAELFVQERVKEIRI